MQPSMGLIERSLAGRKADFEVRQLKLDLA
jgi:hypothetical protein